MRALMGLIKDRHGTYYAQQRVPERLQVAVARYLGNGKPKQVYQKKSLGTKDLRTANVRAKPVLAGFDRVLREAAALAVPKSTPPLRSSLNVAEIARMSEALYGKLLADDEAFRFGGRARIAETVEWIRRNEKPDFQLPYPIESVREYGWHPEQLARQKEHMIHELATMQEALALGDITAVEDDVSLLLADFEINLDRKSPAYRELGMQALQAYVRALQAIDKRNAGEPIDTPKFTRGPLSTPVGGGTLREAFDGWNKARARPDDTVTEYRRAVEMFIQLHGNLAVAEIKRRHALAYREEIQLVPSSRAGKLRKATLPELSAWGREHPDARRVSPGTVNKQLGAMQAVGIWAHDHGLMPDDLTWADPFQRLRVEEDRSDRGPFVTSELQVVFDAPLFTAHDWPVGARGAAGVWLPLLSLFTGARQSEIAGLKASNITEDDETGTPLMYIVSERKKGRRLKTKPSERVIPIHIQLIELGFLKFVDERRSESADAWLFPLVSPAKGRSGVKAWSKWFSGYLRNKVGVKDTGKVFHSFRHGVQDALRRATPDEELRDAIQGRSNKKSVGRDYGAKEMLARWGVETLQEAVSKISYPGLDLSRVRPFAAVKRVHAATSETTWPTRPAHERKGRRSVQR
jgi:integrase